MKRWIESVAFGVAWGFIGAVIVAAMVGLGLALIASIEDLGWWALALWGGVAIVTASFIIAIRSDRL